MDSSLPPQRFVAVASEVPAVSGYAIVAWGPQRKVLEGAASQPSVVPWSVPEVVVAIVPCPEEQVAEAGTRCCPLCGGTS